MPVVSNHTALYSDFYWTGSEESGRSSFVTYSFPTRAPGYLSDYYTPNQLQTWRGFNPQDRALAEQAIDKLESVTGLKFIEVEGVGDITFQWANFNTIPGFSDSSGFAYFPDVFRESGRHNNTATDIGGDIFANTAYAMDNTEKLELIIHELGHAVGLDHPFDGEVTLRSDLDNVRQTVMSYTYVDGYVADRYGPLDIAALHQIYGRPKDFGSHLSSWNWDAASQTLTQNGTGGNDSVKGGNGNDEIGGAAGKDSLDGGAGNDTLYGGLHADDLDGHTGHDVIWAGNGTDKLTGWSGDDTLGGGIGNDTINGGSGNDVIYGGRGAAALNNDVIDAGTGNDTIYAGNGADSITGLTGEKLLFGGDGNDTIDVSLGESTIWGGRGNDLLKSGVDSDVFAFAPGSGHDTIEGFSNSPLLGDRIDITEYDVNNSAFEETSYQSGNDVLIVLSDTDSILVLNFDLADIDNALLI
jgi:Ca2+-binding RTX toxin-like protein